jgi:hypothetical protein
MNYDPARLQIVKDRVWFYEFDLADGTHTRADIPREELLIHTSRRDKLRWVIQEHIPGASNLSALDCIARRVLLDRIGQALRRCARAGDPPRKYRCSRPNHKSAGSKQCHLQPGRPATK